MRTMIEDATNALMVSVLSREQRPVALSWTAGQGLTAVGGSCLLVDVAFEGTY